MPVDVDAPRAEAIPMRRVPWRHTSLALSIDEEKQASSFAQLGRCKLFFFSSPPRFVSRLEHGR